MAARCAWQDLGQVIDSVENDKTASWSGTQQIDRAIVLAIQRQPGTNTVEVVDRIKALLPAVPRADSRRGSLEILYDRSESIRESVNDVKFTLLLTVWPGDPGDLPFPAKPLRHAHSQPGAADVDRGHIRRDVCARLQPRQSFADGADAVGGLRGG